MSKEKRSHKGLKIFLGIFIPLFIVIILPISLAFIFLYDSSFNDEKYPTNLTVEKCFNDGLYSSVENTKEDGFIKFNGTEYALNSLLHSIIDINNLLDNASNYVPNYYFDINNSDLTLSIDLKLSFFKTKLKLIIEPSLHKDETNIENDYFSLKIKDIKVGRISGIYNLAKSYLKNIDDNEINNLFKSNNVTVHSDLKNGEIKYFISDLLNDCKAILISNPNESILISILNFTFNNQLVDLLVNQNESISLSLDLNGLDDNNKYKSLEKETNIDFDTYIEMLEAVINNEIISNDYKETIFSYLIFGYDKLTNNEKAIIDDLDLSIIGITNNQTYQGIQYNGVTDLNEIVNNNITYSNPYESILKIDEDEFNGFLKNQNLIGYNYLFEKEKDNHYSYNFLAIDDFYINFLNDKLYLDIGFSINGFDTSIFMDFVSTNGNDKIELSLSNVYFGELEANQETIDLLFDILVSNFKDENGVLSINKNSHSMIIDITSIFSQDIKNNLSMLGGEISCSIVGNSLIDNGYLNIKLK